MSNEIEVAFVEVENEGWPSLTIAESRGGSGWAAYVRLEDGQIFRTFSGYTPDEAVARLEKMLIEELSVPGPGAADRRSGFGRRAYDGPGITGGTYHGAYNPDLDRRR